MLQHLDKLNGGNFDLAYIRVQVMDHQMAVQFFEWEIGSGQDPRLRAFAAQLLPTVLHHFQLASAIQTELAASLPSAPPQVRACPIQENELWRAEPGDVGEFYVKWD
jgi:putative membrane protein